MVELTKLTDWKNEEFEPLWNLYVYSFPVEERRDKEQLKDMIVNEKRMSFNKVEYDGKLAGLFIYWKLDGFVYMEHLAIFPEMRNARIGGQVLDLAGEKFEGMRVFEVEPPVDEITTRRVAFYRRHNYDVVDKTYYQPSYRPKGEGCPLWIMSNREDAGLQNKLEQLKDVVYHRTR